MELFCRPHHPAVKMASHPQLSHQPGKFPVHVNFNQLRSDISVEINTIEETINASEWFHSCSSRFDVSASGSE